MWGLLAKGKEFAENIDKQLNESVGVDGKPVTSTDGDDLNDAWNDDFEEDVTFETKIPEQPPSSTPIIVEERMTEEINFSLEVADPANERKPPIMTEEFIPSMALENSPVVSSIQESEFVKKPSETPTVDDEQQAQGEVNEMPETESSISLAPFGNLLNQATKVPKVAIIENIGRTNYEQEDVNEKPETEASTSLAPFGDLLKQATRVAKAAISDTTEEIGDEHEQKLEEVNEKLETEASTSLAPFGDLLNQATKVAKAAIYDSMEGADVEQRGKVNEKLETEASTSLKPSGDLLNQGTKATISDNIEVINSDNDKPPSPASVESEFKIVGKSPALETGSPVMEEDSPVVVEEQDAGWENDLYDEEDDDEEEDEEIDRPRESIAVSNNKGPTPTASKTETPPATITIPSVDAAATEERFRQLQEDHEMVITTLKSQAKQLQVQLQQRESQLSQKAEQMAAMQAIHESEKVELQSKIAQTKEEAKRRIQKAKDRVESMEASMTGKEDLVAKDKTITALREEGQKLALKQSEMSQAVRAAKGETRELKSLLEDETNNKEKALEKINSLETDLKKMKEDLSSTRKGEAKAVKLENEVASLKEAADRKETANMSLQQNIKELKAENKELLKDLESTQKGAMLDSKRESNKLKKEHGDILSEMEDKLRTLEKDSSVREDSLRQEVDELRRRWQDSVRRADALSMDVQNSTAPLLRQLESMERQNRARATAWAELETKLRSDLEENIIENEKLTKERNDSKSNLNRTTRISKERNEELTTCKSLIEDQRSKIEKQEVQIIEMETESRKREEEYSEVQRLANEGVSKVRSDMMKTVLENEERCQTQLKSMEKDLTEESSKRTLLERQVEELLENAGMALVPTPAASSTLVVKSSKVKKLRSVEGQADILAGAIGSLDENAEEADDDEVGTISEDEAQGPLSSFAAMEQLSQGLKESKIELEAMRASLASSESVRASLLEELSETRVAKEKLPLFQAKVQELAVAVQQKDVEIMTLKEDIAEIRQLYRAQLNTLLEEKAANLSEVSERRRLSEEDKNESKNSTKILQVASSPDQLTSDTPIIDDDKSKSSISKQD
mmetsp:Transcript_23391/g.35414  ORF Transcript_23391/g.35414 Transcript_23391/m.35414 type:complete len:1087 (-) Transcript_23391:278-3538(-)